MQHAGIGQPQPQPLMVLARPCAQGGSAAPALSGVQSRSSMARLTHSAASVHTAPESR
jgi:hypothetical protein